MFDSDKQREHQDGQSYSLQHLSKLLGITSLNPALQPTDLARTWFKDTLSLKQTPMWKEISLNLSQP